MAKGDKLVGAMGKGPSKDAMTRVSPGVYRSAEGKLVGSKGQALPQASRQAQMNDATNLALNNVSQYGNMPQSNQPMQTLPLTFQPGQAPTMDQMKQMFGQMQQPQMNPLAKIQAPDGQAYRYGNPSGIPWQDVQGGIAQGSLRNMAQGMRMKQQMPQPMPMPMPGRGSKQ